MWIFWKYRCAQTQVFGNLLLNCNSQVNSSSFNIKLYWRYYLSLLVVSRLACQAVVHASAFYPFGVTFFQLFVQVLSEAVYLLNFHIELSFLCLVEAKGWFILKGSSKLSEMMNSRGFSPSSFFSEEVCLSDEVLIAHALLNLRFKKTSQLWVYNLAMNISFLTSSL